MKREADTLAESESNQVYMPDELVAYLRERIVSSFFVYYFMLSELYIGPTVSS